MKFLLASLIITMLSPIEGDSIFSLGDKQFFDHRYDKAIEFYTEAATFYSKKDSLKESNAYNDIGLCYYKLGSIDSAIFFYKKALAIDSGAHNIKNIINRTCNLAIAYRAKGLLAEATDLLLETKGLANKTGDLVGSAALSTLLGNIYLDQEEHNFALESFKKSLETHHQRHDSVSMAIAYNNLGVASLQAKDVEQALHFLRQALSLKKRHSSKASLAHTQHSLGELFKLKSETDSAKYYLHCAFTLRDSLMLNRGRAYTSHQLAKLYLSLDRPTIAKKYLEIATNYLREVDDRSFRLEHLHLEAQFYQTKNDWEQAYHSLELWTSYRDSVFNEEKLKVQRLVSKQTIDQHKQKQLLAEQSLLRAENERVLQERWTIIYLLVASALFLFLITALYFVFAVNKQKKIVSRLNLALDAKNQKITLLNNENLHFTKNAFTEISSLLRIQSAKLTGPGKDLITGMQLRIETIGLLYRQLFVENTNQTKLDVLISAIANNTLDGLADYTVIRDFKLAPVTASKELALNLALIANEICINACKYAFSAKGQDRLALRLSMDDQSKLVLVFCDHGSGLPADVHWETSASFGLRLIRLLAQDSDAKMTVSNDNSSGLIYRFEIFIKNHNDSN